MMTSATILVVDDIAANRDTLGELLAADGFRLVEAADGLKALQLAAANPPDLILLDVMMPGMDGFEVCRRLRADPHLAEVPVIMITALDDPSSRLAGLEAGADDFITKPLNGAELRARVRTVARLNRYRRLTEQRAQFQWMVEDARDGYVLVNEADEILFANSCARQWLGLKASEKAEGAAPEPFLAAVRRAYTTQPPEHWAGWPQIPSSIVASPRLLVRPETPQARSVFLEVFIHQNSGGRLLRLQDVTERLAARRDQSSFQGMVSHKLRTPLNGVLGMLDLLSDPGALSPEEIAEYAVIARQSADQLGGAVEEVLRFAELSRTPAPAAGFALAGLEELVRSLAAELVLPGVAVLMAGGTSAARFPGAAATLEWVLFELLQNAKKFHPRHAPKVEVSVRREENGMLSLAVSDDGVTLLPEQLARAGSPYFQAEKHFTGELPGMGLGLASVAAAAWQIGGSFHVRNQFPGPGVRVELHWQSQTKS